MREFDRIMIDFNVANGLPCIRDTGITVGEIVRVLQGQKSAQQLIDEYIQIENEDITQALSYTIHTLDGLTSSSRIDSVRLFEGIAGGAGLLIDDLDANDFDLQTARKMA